MANIACMATPAAAAGIYILKLFLLTCLFFPSSHPLSSPSALFVPIPLGPAKQPSRQRTSETGLPETLHAQIEPAPFVFTLASPPLESWPFFPASPPHPIFAGK
ncbi:hypothetical protein BKA65DRAFT_163976 [Rhexocercosporidium sp. MPI-PUGE-AT-0058]|nr:hypothetical protein BKA65DRAFT_163976 [Rhexocercosporidium sp. MPI-PUGE-AT-0058]